MKGLYFNLYKIDYFLKEKTLKKTSLSYWNSAFCPPEERNFCNIKWYGCFLSSNNIGDVNPTEHTRNVNL
jgi:hypothetical protein